MDPIFLSILAIAIVFLFSVTVYALGRLLAPPFDKTNLEKIKPYSCGEELPSEQIQVVIHQYYLVVLFTVLEVATLFFALTIYSPLMLIPLIYFIIVMFMYVAYRSG